jgi:hypothetical protein
LDTFRTLTEIGVSELSAMAAGISIFTFGIVTVCVSRVLRKTDAVTCHQADLMVFQASSH